jgi:hypothetical protein
MWYVVIWNNQMIYDLWLVFDDLQNFLIRNTRPLSIPRKFSAARWAKGTRRTKMTRKNRENPKALPKDNQSCKQMAETKSSSALKIKGLSSGPWGGKNMKNKKRSNK